MSADKPEKTAMDAASMASRSATDAASQFANLYGGAFSASFKTAQDYQTKLMQFFQTNAEANVRFTQRLMETKSPADFVELLSSHLRDRAVAMGEQARELASMGQEASRAAMESLTQAKR